MRAFFIIHDLCRKFFGLKFVYGVYLVFVFLSLRL